LAVTERGCWTRKVSMARPIQISPSEVEAAAFELVRTTGLAALTARRVADALGSSTQPVYSSWGSMSGLRDRLEQRAIEFIMTYLAQSEPDAAPMLALGLRTVRLAIEEPHIFDLADRWMREHWQLTPPAPVLAALRADPRLCEASPAELTRVNALLWVFTLGLCALATADGPLRTVEQARPLLEAAGTAFVGLVAAPS
jgi:AcrR family transcriptional regulator